MSAIDDLPPMTAPTDVTIEEVTMVRLLAKLEERAPLVDLYTDYYEGRHRLAFVTAPYRQAFGRMLAGVSDNWCGLVVQAGTERLEVQAFVVGDGSDIELDAAALDLWRREGLELDASLAFAEAAKIGESYLLVTVDADGVAHITVEHPRQFIVERHPADRRIITAALKAWWSDAYDEMHITLWTPDAIIRRARRRNGVWVVPRDNGDQDEGNPFGEVPVAALVNDPQMIPASPPLSLLIAPHSAPDVPIGLGRSDLSDIISSQDAIDQLISNMLIAAEFAAFRQRWATGLEIPKDPDTGEPIQPFRAAVERVWVSEKPDTRFGEFAPTDLQNYINAITWHVQSIASRTRIPPHILMSGSGNWPSGESLRAAETGLLSKVHSKMRSFTPALTRALSLGLRAEGVDAPMITVDWVDPERRIESEFADSLIKKLALGVPPQQLWADAGYSPEQIALFPELLAKAAAFETAATPPPTGEPSA
jgi:Phage portal protein, SPP1 Gp6-like